MILWRARNALAAGDPHDLLARGRMAEHLIAGAQELQGVGPFDEGAAFAQRAQRLAQTGRQHAFAAFLGAGHLRELGRIEHARAGFTAALEIYRDLGHRRGEASVRTGLADCDRQEGRVEDARAGFTAALEIYRDAEAVQAKFDALNGGPPAAAG